MSEGGEELPADPVAEIGDVEGGYAADGVTDGDCSEAEDTIG